MNRRKRKKKQAQEINKELLIILRTTCPFRSEDYERMKQRVEYQISEGGKVLILPAYLSVEAIVQKQGSRRIEIKHEMQAAVQKGNSPERQQATQERG